ncbi:MAG TPA: DUF6496 domain-containing protein [Bryobacteraceae bacterium]|nr:DUF6496 domain-containing protein [Bryobacteraceae bacterium]
MATRKKSTKGARKVHRVMKEHKEGELKSGSGRKVTSRKQAVAIALNEARESGAKIPKKKSASKKKSSSGKSTGKKQSSTKKKSSRKSSK